MTFFPKRKGRALRSTLGVPLSLVSLGKWSWGTRARILTRAECEARKMIGVRFLIIIRVIVQVLIRVTSKHQDYCPLIREDEGNGVVCWDFLERIPEPLSRGRRHEIDNSRLSVVFQMMLWGRSQTYQDYCPLIQEDEGSKVVCWDFLKRIPNPL